MKKSFNAKFLAYGNMAQFLTDNASLWEGFIALQEAITEFFDALDQLTLSYVSTTTETSGLVDAKQAQLIALKDLCIRLSYKAFVWADKLQDHTSLAILDITPNDFYTSQMEQINIAKNVHGVLVKNLEALTPYKIDRLQVDALWDNIKLAENNFTSTTIAQKSKTVAFQSFPGLFTKADVCLDRISRLIQSEYTHSHITTVQQFLLLMKIDRPPVRHTTIRGKIFDLSTGNEINGAYCNLLEIDGEETFSDLTGFYEIKEFKAGSLTFEIVKEGYEPFRQVVHIKRGQVAELNIQLKPRLIA